MARPIILPLLALMAGITCSSLLRIPDPPVQAFLVFVLLILLVWMKRERRILYPFLLLSFFLAGILAMNRDLHPYRGGDHIINYVGHEKINVEGVIYDNPEVMHDRMAFVLSVSRVLREGVYAPASGQLLVGMREPGVLRYGDAVRITTRLRLPHSFHNPGGFDYERHLRFRGILVRGFVNDPTGLVVLRRDRGNPLRAALENFRSLLRQSILETAPATEGSIIQAMLLGDQKGIPKETMDLFNRTGTTHIIAISGFNIGIVAVFSLFVVRLFLKSSEYLLLRWNLNVISTVCAIVVVVLYTFIAGSGISVVRASIMVVLFMVAILINRERDLYNTLALAAFLILIVSPSSLFDISFQLSFSAVAALLFLMPRLTALLPSPAPSVAPGSAESEGVRRRYTIRALRGLALFCFTCVSATLGTLPLVVFYFNRLSIVTLAANLLVVPILGIIAIPFCLLIVLAVPISTTLADLIIRVSAWLVRVSLVMTEQLAAPSWSSVYVATPSLVAIAAFYLLLISLGFLLDARRNRKEGLPPPKTALFWKAIAVVMVLFFIADATLSHQRALHRGRLTLTAVDVGQGSATLIRFPGGKRMLVDGGGFFDGTFDVGKYVLAPFLWHEQIRRIDTLVLTHPHPDHLGGLLFIVENFQVSEVWSNGDESESPLYRSFLQCVRNRGIALKVLSEATPEIDISGVKVRILNPGFSSDPSSEDRALPAGEIDRKADQGPPPDPDAPLRKRPRVPDALNDRSLVLRLAFGGRAFLLPGDISEPAERRLALSGSVLRSDVLFAPHHGGLRSSTALFLDRVRPQIAVISCGKDNVFRLPHAEVIGRYERLQTRIYRTDRDGAVTVATDGKDLRVETFRPERFR